MASRTSQEFLMNLYKRKSNNSNKNTIMKVEERKLSTGLVIRLVTEYKHCIFVKYNDAYYALDKNDNIIFYFDENSVSTKGGEKFEGSKDEKVFSPEIFAIMLRNLLLKQLLENNYKPLKVNVYAKTEMCTCTFSMSRKRGYVKLSYGPFDDIEFDMSDIGYIVTTDEINNMLKENYGIDNMLDILPAFDYGCKEEMNDNLSIPEKEAKAWKEIF